MNTEEVIIKYLKEGKEQHEISDLLKKDGIRPNSLSHIEKSLKAIRERYGAKTMFHLGVILSKQSMYHTTEAQPLEGVKTAEGILFNHVGVVNSYWCEPVLKAMQEYAETYHAQFATDAGGVDIDAMAKDRYPNHQQSDFDRGGVIGFITGYKQALSAHSTHSSSEMVEVEKVNAVQDDSGHWYVIPSSMVKKFFELDEAIGSENVVTSNQADDEFSMLFSKYRTGGDLNNIQLYAKI